MNDPNLEYAACQADSEILGHQVFYVLGPERVQIKDAVDGQVTCLSISHVVILSFLHAHG